MLDEKSPQASAIVTLPAEIDLTNRQRVYDQIHAAFASGAATVIADFTATTFCDCSSLRGLLTVQRCVSSRYAQLRLAIPPGTVASRVAELLGLDRQLLIYPGLDEARSSRSRSCARAPE